MRRNGGPFTRTLRSGQARRSARSGCAAGYLQAGRRRRRFRPEPDAVARGPRTRGHELETLEAHPARFQAGDAAVQLRERGGDQCAPNASGRIVGDSLMKRASGFGLADRLVALDEGPPGQQLKLAPTPTLSRAW